MTEHPIARYLARTVMRLLLGMALAAVILLAIIGLVVVLDHWGAAS